MKSICCWAHRRQVSRRNGGELIMATGLRAGRRQSRGKTLYGATDYAHQTAPSKAPHEKKSGKRQIRNENAKKRATAAPCRETRARHSRRQHGTRAAGGSGGWLRRNRRLRNRRVRAPATYRWRRMEQGVRRMTCWRRAAQARLHGVALK